MTVEVSFNLNLGARAKWGIIGLVMILLGVLIDLLPGSPAISLTVLSASLFFLGMITAISSFGNMAAEEIERERESLCWPRKLKKRTRKKRATDMSQRMKPTHLFTELEDADLLELVDEQAAALLFDPQLAWQRIAVQMGRTGSQCRDRWVHLMQQYERKSV